jgi:hypothetical protein
MKNVVPNAHHMWMMRSLKICCYYSASEHAKRLFHVLYFFTARSAADNTAVSTTHYSARGNARETAGSTAHNTTAKPDANIVQLQREMVVAGEALAASLYISSCCCSCVCVDREKKLRCKAG